MNVNSILTKDYERNDIFTVPENKANSNPIKANLRKAQMNVNSFITKDYRKKDDFAVQKNKPNSNPISSKAKMNVNLYVIEDYENETAFRLRKNKPNQTQSRNNSNRYFASRGSGRDGGFTIDDLRLWGEIGAFESLWLFLVLKSAKSVVNSGNDNRAIGPDRPAKLRPSRTRQHGLIKDTQIDKSAQV